MLAFSKSSLDKEDELLVVIMWSADIIYNQFTFRLIMSPIV